MLDLLSVTKFSITWYSRATLVDPVRKSPRISFGWIANLLFGSLGPSFSNSSRSSSPSNLLAHCLASSAKPVRNSFLHSSKCPRISDHELIIGVAVLINIPFAFSLFILVQNWVSGFRLLWPSSSITRSNRSFTFDIQMSLDSTSLSMTDLIPKVRETNISWDVKNTVLVASLLPTSDSAIHVGKHLILGSFLVALRLTSLLMCGGNESAST